jgi:hypothetical protein
MNEIQFYRINKKKESMNQDLFEIKEKNYLTNFEKISEQTS